MKHNVDFNIALLLFFGLGSMLLVSTNDMYPPPLSTTLLNDSEGRRGDMVVSMNIEKINGRRFENGFIITLTLRNEGSESYSRDLRQPVFDVYAYDANGRLVADWSSCYEMLDLPIPIHLERNGEFTEIKSWEPNVLDSREGTVKPLPPGRYYLKGVWLGRPLIETGLISVDIV
jgi:hypothetical protein